MIAVKGNELQPGDLLRLRPDLPAIRIEWLKARPNGYLLDGEGVMLLPGREGAVRERRVRLTIAPRSTYQVEPTDAALHKTEEKPPAPRVVRCHGTDLADGDVVLIGQRRCTIVHICEPYVHSFRHGTVRNALVLWQDGDKPAPYRFGHFANSFFTITGGPKTLASASQLRTMPAGYTLWEGT